MSFTVGGEAVDLPGGAFAHSRRIDVRWQGRHVCSLSQGPWRSYLYPVYTPAGVAVTSESPVDHPHHNSLWCAADRVTAHLPFDGGESEPAVYNFYVNDTFQGRAPGRILATDLTHQPISETHLRLWQDLQWRGPREWGAPDGRVILQERRTIDVRCVGDVFVFDVRSRLTPTEWDISIGATRHAYHGVRVVESLRESHGGRIVASNDRQGAAEANGSDAAWVGMTGPVGADRTAGVALMPHGDGTGSWFVTDWGTMTVNPFESESRHLTIDASLTIGARYVTHDGAENTSRLNKLAAEVQATLTEDAE